MDWSSVPCASSPIGLLTPYRPVLPINTSLLRVPLSYYDSCVAGMLTHRISPSLGPRPEPLIRGSLTRFSTAYEWFSFAQAQSTSIRSC